MTWNDYEEGTEIESGIDNCVSVSTSVAGDSLSWKITGQENTVDHYTPYISSDGQNLMPLNDLATGQHALNMCNTRSRRELHPFRASCRQGKFQEPNVRSSPLQPTLHLQESENDQIVPEVVSSGYDDRSWESGKN